MLIVLILPPKISQMRLSKNQFLGIPKLYPLGVGTGGICFFVYLYISSTKRDFGLILMPKCHEKDYNKPVSWISKTLPLKGWKDQMCLFNIVSEQNVIWIDSSA